MAVATVTSRDITVTLELTEQEALYVYAALRLVDPTPASGVDESDPVYVALEEALDDAGLKLYDDIKRARIN